MYMYLFSHGTQWPVLTWSFVALPPPSPRHHQTGHVAVFRRRAGNMRQMNATSNPFLRFYSSDICHIPIEMTVIHVWKYRNHLCLMIISFMKVQISVKLSVVAKHSCNFRARWSRISFRQLIESVYDSRSQIAKENNFYTSTHVA